MKLTRLRPFGPVVRPAREHIEQCERSLLAAQDEAVRALDASLRERPEAWEHTAAERFAVARTMAKARAALEAVRLGREPARELQAVPAPSPGGWHVLVSTLFLLDSLAHATGDKQGRERMYLVTGPVTKDGVHVLSRLHEVALAEQSTGYVKLNPHDSHFQIIELDEVHGHQLTGTVHSHPGRGADATRPSGTDIANQRRFDVLGIQAIAGICTADGHFRFWSNGKPFTLDVYGKGWQMLEDDACMKVLKLDQIAETAA